MHARITFVIVCLSTMGSIGGCEEKSNTSTGGVGAVSGKSLHQAALDGDLPSLKKLLDNGGLINQEDSDGYRPLHWACWGKHSDAVKELLERGASVREKQDESAFTIPPWARIHTPLALAIYKKDFECCRLLLVAGANPNGEPMQLAAYLGQDGVFNVLIGGDSLRDSDDPPLIVLAGAGGNSQTVVRLLSLGVDIDRRAKSHSQLDDILTPTQYRVQSPVAPKAPEHTFGWDLTLPYLDGQTALEVSAERGHDEVVKLLLARGANKHPSDVTGRNQIAKPISYGMTRHPPPALFLAAQAGRTSTVRLLAEAGFDVNERTHDDDLPLSAAAHHCHPDTCAELLRLGAKVDAPAMSPGISGRYTGGPRWTALQDGAASGCVEVVRLLLDAGADREARDTAGSRAIELAADRGRAEVVRILREVKKP